MKAGEKGTIEDEMAGWHHQLNRHDSEQALRVGDGQGSLACCSPWSCKELDMTEQMNWTELYHLLALGSLHVFRSHWQSKISKMWLIRGVCVCVCVYNCVLLFAIPWTVAHQAPLSMGFSRGKYWSELPFPSPGNLLDPGIETESPALARGFFTTTATWEAFLNHYFHLLRFLSI